MRYLKAIACLLLFLHVLHGQPAQPAPDCTITGTFTAAAQTSPANAAGGFDNRTIGCTTWSVVVSTSGFTAWSVTLQSAPDNSGVPGSWVTYANQTLVSGTNPLTGTTGGASWVVLTGFNPWVRVILSSLTGSGTVSGSASGWKIPSAAE